MEYVFRCTERDGCAVSEMERRPVVEGEGVGVGVASDGWMLHRDVVVVVVVVEVVVEATEVLPEGLLG